MPKLKQYTVHGKTQDLRQWAKQAGVSEGLIRYRLTAGWPLERALTAPLGAKRGFHVALSSHERAEALLRKIKRKTALIAEHQAFLNKLHAEYLELVQ